MTTITSFHARMCCHLVRENEAFASRLISLCGSVCLFLIVDSHFFILIHVPLSRDATPKLRWPEIRISKCVVWAMTTVMPPLLYCVQLLSANGVISPGFAFPVPMYSLYVPGRTKCKLQEQKCSPDTLVSGDIRLVWIYSIGVLRGGTSDAIPPP